MRVKKDKCYVIVSKLKGYIQGAFPLTEEGKEMAKQHLKRINENEEYKITVV